MRRPVKPFVTEYKGSGRRGKDSRPEAEAEEPKPKGVGSRGAEAKPSGKGSHHAATARGAPENRASLPPRGLFRGADEAEPIGSYEAAMRAADALFSPKPRPEAAEAAKPAAPAPGAGNEAPAGHPEATGRVLRALDEPAPAAPEPMPELAPKRRGRKPGSVNKPKADRVPETARRRLAEPAAAPPAEPEEPDDLLDEVDPIVAEAPMDPGTPAAQVAPVARAAQQRDRFPWVRTKLGPGEKWKRRLPKVAW